MHKVIRDIIAEIDQKFEFKYLKIDFENRSCTKSIPSNKSGWYLIKTDMPVSDLAHVGPPRGTHHIDIPETIRTAQVLRSSGIVITQTTKGQDYVVYNGEAKDLRARAREHICGHSKTFCLGLSDYKILHNYNWTFCYVAVSDCETIQEESKLIRLAVEQAWRAVHGWPILCRR